MARPARIDRRQVLREAMSLADAEGLDALTMSALAQRLAVTPMALYRHVGDKAGVIDGLVELLIAGVVADAPPGTGWQTRLRAYANRLRATAQQHPHVFPVLLQRPASTTGARVARDQITAALLDGGITPEPAAQLQRVLSSAMLGFTLSEAAGRFAELTAEQRDADFELLVTSLLAVVEAQRGDRATPD